MSDFTFPPYPWDREKPKYSVEAIRVKSRPGCWDITNCIIHRNTYEDGRTQQHPIYEYVYEYPSSNPPFEPFRQFNGKEWREYALFSSDYTRTSVLDLESLATVAEEEGEYFTTSTGKHMMKEGFCPVQLYVPDYDDVHQDPEREFNKEDEHWDISDERPIGQFGFVAGCIWGDDAGGWKIQYLDLSKISSGEIKRDDRFGYIELPYNLKLKDAIRYHEGTESFTIGIQLIFNKEGQLNNWYKNALLNKESY